MCSFGSKRERYSTHTCNTEGFTYEHSLTFCLLRFTGNKKRRKELVSSINGRLFTTQGENFRVERAQRIAPDEELREADASGGSAKSSQKKGEESKGDDGERKVIEKVKINNSAEFLQLSLSKRQMIVQCLLVWVMTLISSNS